MGLARVFPLKNTSSAFGGKYYAPCRTRPILPPRLPHQLALNAACIPRGLFYGRILGYAQKEMTDRIIRIAPGVPQRGVTTSEFAKKAGKSVTIQGAIHRTRALGGVIFVVVRDREGLIQAVIDPKRFRYQEDDLREGNFVVIEGTVHQDKRAPHGAEVRVKKLTVVGTTTGELPVVLDHPTLDVHLETNLHYRPITLRHPRERAIFRIGAALAEGFREFLRLHGFTEVFTPKIVAAGAEGGANVFALEYFKKHAYLAQSPQLYKQMMVGVYERVFEIGHVYRAEQHNTSRHLNEYVSMDFEMGFVEGLDDVLATEGALLQSLLAQLPKRVPDELALLEVKLPKAAKIPVLTLADAVALLKGKLGYHPAVEHDLDQKSEQLLCEYAAKEWESEFVFITHYPRAKRPFYAMDDPQNSELTLSFDLLFRGLEVTTGGQRIHRYDEQVKKMKEFKLDPKDFEHFLMIHKYGMPPHGGLAIGLERLLVRLLNLPNVREGALFPRDIDRLTP